MFVTFFAFELMAQHGIAAGLRGDPLAGHPRGIVADVLVVSAVELCDPVALVVFVIADDGLLHLVFLG